MIQTELDKNSIKIITTEIEYLDIVKHYHTNHHQLIYTIKGTVKIILDEIDYLLPEGHIAIIPTQILHSLHSNNVRIKLFLLYYPAAMLPLEFKIINTNDFIIENIRYISKQSQLLNNKEHPELYQYIMSFLNLPNFKEDNAILGLKGLIAPKNERLKPVLEYIKNNYTEDIKLSEVADKFGFTERNLSRIFKKENISFNNFLNYQRITRAIELFSEQKSNMESIAFTVGYKTPSNFSRTFKKFTGHAPTDFLNIHQTRKINE